MKEPETDAEFAKALKEIGHEVFEDDDGWWGVAKIGLGNRTVLEATDYSSALFEAWNLVKP